MTINLNNGGNYGHRLKTLRVNRLLEFAVFLTSTLSSHLFSPLILRCFWLGYSLPLIVTVRPFWSWVRIAVTAASMSSIAPLKSNVTTIDPGEKATSITCQQ